ncbi:MAG: hypothetical protein A4E65_00381 [Syntrophorhabdus sp. PtaU1.Bin153]|nr:MAG: hypothetical protein A4E65_00381 [Syntrophorhabdus sp. PtaU1.Bin153]
MGHGLHEGIPGRPLLHGHHEVPPCDLLGYGGYLVHGIDEHVEVVLDLVEITLVLVGDPGRDVTLADVVDIVGGNGEGGHEGIHEAVRSAYEPCPVSLEGLCIGTGLEVPFEDCLGEVIQFPV